MDDAVWGAQLEELWVALTRLPPTCPSRLDYEPILLQRAWLTPSNLLLFHRQKFQQL